MADFTKDEIEALAARYDENASSHRLYAEQAYAHGRKIFWRDKADKAELIATALRALAKSMDAEPAGWQRRWRYPSAPGASAEWEQCGSAEANDPFARSPYHDYRQIFAAPPVSAPAEPVATKWVSAVMEQAQVFASTYSLVGGRFDDGTRMAQSEVEKDKLHAMLVSPPAPVDEAGAAMPAGWKLVPEEPTEPMLDEADRAVALPEDYIRKAYRAMLAAAPPPPARQDKTTDELIDVLTDGEGDNITFCSPNPDFNGLPNECVTVNASWTGWQDREFRADTRRQCLLDAVHAARQIGEANDG